MSKNCKTLKREKLQLCLSHKSSEGQNTSWDKKYYKNYFGRELWSSGYGRSLVRTPTPYTGWTFFTGIFVVKIVMFLWKDETKEKEAGVGPFFKKYCKGISRPGNYSSCSPSQKEKSDRLWMFWYSSNHAKIWQSAANARKIKWNLFSFLL